VLKWLDIDERRSASSTKQRTKARLAGAMSASERSEPVHEFTSSRIQRSDGVLQGSGASHASEEEPCSSLKRAPHVAERVGQEHFERCSEADLGPPRSCSTLIRAPEIADGIEELAGSPRSRCWGRARNVLAQIRAVQRGGTSEVLRNIIAERILGLPHDQDVERGLTWSEGRARLKNLA
jgi:hypothetical protein